MAVLEDEVARQSETIEEQQAQLKAVDELHALNSELQLQIAQLEQLLAEKQNQE